MDRLAADARLVAGAKRLGLVTNDAARTAADAGRLSRTALLDAGVPIVRLFSPEHGLSAAAPDGAAAPGGTDPVTGLPVVSLYGERMQPAPESLEGLEGVLVDLPDIGARCYTYVWTMTHVVDACAEAGLPVWILDRPNPLGGALAAVEGPMLEPEHRSFIGRHTIPLRHGLTLGELARLWQRERCPAAAVRVIACEGWRREQLWPDTGLPFVATSPAIRRFDAALLYPGLCLFEATNLSVGRGTDSPFEVVGAPWLDAAAVAARLAARQPPGVVVTAGAFTPEADPYAGQRCEAVRITVQDPAHVRPVALGLALLADIAEHHRGVFAWARYPTAANPTGAGHLERLAGTGAIRRAIDAAPNDVDSAIIAAWTAAPGWAERWHAVRLYD
ncbi:MAG TPA: DUF1343 domain-containing protein [Longimicrobiales bacterium]